MGLPPRHSRHLVHFSRCAKAAAALEALKRGREPLKLDRISHRDFFNLTVQICATYQRGEERSESAGGNSDAPILMQYTRKHHANIGTFLSMSA